MKPKFGDIYTNGINHWIVTLAGMVCCPQCCAGVQYRVELRPIIFSNGIPRHIEKSQPIIGIDSIKPDAHKVGELIINP
jgi:hypothetical protein